MVFTCRTGEAQPTSGNIIAIVRAAMSVRMIEVPQNRAFRACEKTRNWHHHGLCLLSPSKFSVVIVAISLLDEAPVGG
jgi:hypothetical protein